jgi:hypothetical protein
MNDIVERLRISRGNGDIGVYQLCQDAADEIERLRTERDKWKQIADDERALSMVQARTGIRP